jgi:NAD-dependent dihydropyrimidine dehydrogenase PreA subunit
LNIADTCIACGSCVPYCPMSAISLGSEQAEVNLDECVECNVCLRAGVCPTDSLVAPKLEWPRSLRRVFSDPGPLHDLTGVPGRGTEEMKTNDVTGRYKLGEAGIILDIGRPGLGTRFYDVEKIYRRLYKLGIRMEKQNPVASLLKDIDGSEFKEEVLKEKVMSAIIEFIVPSGKLDEALSELKKCGPEIDTVFSVGLIDKVAVDGSMPNLDKARKLGYSTSINAKVCIGTGRPLAKF